jgi:two-component system sensor histidine kinase CpxA
VGGITRAIRRMNTAAHSITEGRFDVRVPAQRRDELGELAGSVNTMAAQLGDFVERQRRLTADVAHELCSPIARMQRAMGVVEQRATPEQSAYLEKLNRELQHMAALVEEVLAFSKAATVPRQASTEDFDLEKLVAEVVTGEAPESQVEVHIPAGLRLRTYREALDRALANVVRNAVRYAGQSGPIEIRAGEAADRVEIDIRDHGPGVPAQALEQIFEPFFRPEMARQRNTGGAGLGLAIVRRCVEACQGTVTARLPEGGGLNIRLSIPKDVIDLPGNSQP